MRLRKTYETANVLSVFDGGLLFLFALGAFNLPGYFFLLLTFVSFGGRSAVHILLLSMENFVYAVCYGKRRSAGSVNLLIVMLFYTFNIKIFA